MLSVEEAATEESPKRRSTFYVSLQESESRSSKYQRAADSVCNTFPITQSKTVPNVPLLVRSSVESSSSAKKLGEPGSLEPRGKVQSLTRIFETSKGSASPGGGSGGTLNNNNSASSSNLNSSSTKIISSSNNNISKAASAEQRKKVERTRSFKTIERFQNRFVGGKSKTSDAAARKQDQPPGTTRTPGKSYELSKSSSVDRIAPSTEKPAAEVARCQPKIKSRPGGKSTGSAQGTANSSALTNLIRRTHSTKLARSTSAVVRSSEQRHAPGSDGGGSTEPSIKSEEADSGQEEAAVFSDENADAGSSRSNTRNEETDTDAGVHSGEPRRSICSRLVTHALMGPTDC